jgi:hypothetical protein
MSTVLRTIPVQLVIVLLLLVGCPIAARASEPITVIYGRGRESLMNLTMDGQHQLEKGDLAAAQRSRDAGCQPVYCGPVRILGGLRRK